MQSPPTAVTGNEAGELRLACAHCDITLYGSVYMFEDEMYCCQRHRIAGYVKGEEQGRAGVRRLSDTGLRANFRTWI